MNAQNYLLSFVVNFEYLYNVLTFGLGKWPLCLINILEDYINEIRIIKYPISASAKIMKALLLDHQ